MIVVNGSDKEQTIDFSSYSEMLSSKSKLIDLMNDDEITLSKNSKMEIEPLSSKIFLIEK